MKNILVTGGAGYIGHHVLHQLSKLDNVNLLVIDNLSTGDKSRIERVENLSGKRFCFEQLDITHNQEVKNFFDSYAVDSIVHLAGKLNIAEGEAKPDYYYQNNVEGFNNILCSTNKKRPPNIIFSSSAAVYDVHASPAYETHELKPTTVYGNTKLEGEALLAKYSHETRTKNVVLRYFNPIGRTLGLDNDSNSWHVMPSILQSLKEGTYFRIYGTDYDTIDGTPSRDYIHVEDLACAHLSALNLTYAKSDIDFYVFNVGLGHAVSVFELMDNIHSVTGKTIAYKYMSRREGDDAYKCASNEAMISELKFAPRYSVSQAVHSFFDGIDL